MELESYFRFLLALVFVIGLIWLLAAVARRMGFGFPVSSFKGGRARRLSVVEVAPVDGRRRMILVRRDDTEHLILLGPSSELVIESGIHTGETGKTGETSEPGETRGPSVPATGGKR